MLKSELDIGPACHRLPERIGAQTGICFMALILNRIVCIRLKSADAHDSAERGLAYLRRIQYHRIQLDAASPFSGLSTIQDEKWEILRALNVKAPSFH